MSSRLDSSITRCETTRLDWFYHSIWFRGILDPQKHSTHILTREKKFRLENFITENAVRVAICTTTSCIAAATGTQYIVVQYVVVYYLYTLYIVLLYIVVYLFIITIYSSTIYRKCYVKNTKSIQHIVYIQNIVAHTLHNTKYSNYTLYTVFH